MDFETACLHAGYTPGNGEPCSLPIYQSTTYRYDSTDSVAGLFDLTVDGHMYSRISNPTVAFVEQKIAALEGGVGALCTTSGQSATFIALLSILEAGDHVVSSATIYGGTVNLFSITFKKFGVEVSYVSPDASEEEIAAAFRPNTKALFGETMANPAMNVLDIEKFARVAHAHGVPLVVDNTFGTPYLVRPFEWGADIVVHSTTKYLDGHAQTVGGAIVDSGKFDWRANAERFPGLTTPDPSYHGIVYVDQFGESAYITKARVQLMRDLGCYPAALTAFLLNMGLETLPVRMDRVCENGLKVAQFLASRPEIEHVSYPGLESDPYHALAQKYLPRGCSGVMSIEIAGGREKAAAFIDHLKLVRLEVHVADICTCVLHPASSTHRQLTDEQLVACGINPGLVRLSCGLESADDIIADLAQALDALGA
ncbi:MAG: O-acetylhomoserine aminocarboxypropyltransferase/cysteine synthase [Coriobacteriia bacterium]|nr:O-acetylhomoserine aminocarboxypropyltransferase/cysteine synthase [Coriobacteriia bacterium]MBS5477868.1 O-acetylhomoserine aminocarboxypropyltransferase/cysteine synthase [Coriobacteriia bacterium]